MRKQDQALAIEVEHLRNPVEQAQRGPPMIQFEISDMRGLNAQFGGNLALCQLEMRDVGCAEHCRASSLSGRCHVATDLPLAPYTPGACGLRTDAAHVSLDPGLAGSDPSPSCAMPRVRAIQHACVASGSDQQIRCLLGLPSFTSKAIFSFSQGIRFPHSNVIRRLSNLAPENRASRNNGLGFYPSGC